MIIFNQQRVNELISRVSSGFRVDPLYIVLFFLLLISLVAISILSSRMVRRRERDRLALLIERRNESVFDEIELTVQDLDLIGSLSAYLKDPRKRYLLVTNPTVFYAAASAASAAASVAPNAALMAAIDPKAVSLLREKLGFPEKQARERSTKNLPTDAPVVFERARGSKSPGVVIDQLPDGFSIRLKKMDPAIRPGSGVVYCQDERGIFMYTVTVTAVDRDLLNLEHSNKVKVAQRREFFRRKLELAVRIKRSAKEEVSANLIDLSGGGVSLENPGGLKAGDDIELGFPNERDVWIEVPGEIVRLSKGGRVAHVRFGHVQAADRDRIVILARRS